jgi:phage-related protein (TIGR01555 family)
MRDELRGTLSEHKKQLRARVKSLGLESRADHADALDLAMRLRNDSWVNLVSGQGMDGKDRRNASSVVWKGLTMNEQRAESLYAGNALARRMVEHLPYEATRQWITPKNFGDADRAVRDEMDRLGAREEFYTGWCWARQYGGAGTLLVTDEPDEDLAKPLNLENIRRLENLVTFNRWELEAWNSDIDVNLRSRNFRKPKYYRLNVASGGVRIPINVKIHESRIIRWEGLALGPLSFIRNKFWGDSIFSGLADSLGNWDRSVDGIAAVLDEFRLVIHKMPGIADLVASGNIEGVLNRVRTAARSRSLFGTLVADKEEDITSESETFAGVTEVLDRLADNLAAKTEYPKIVLFNSSPDGGGLSGKGYSELQGWYATVNARQTTYLQSRIDAFMKVMLAAKEGPVLGRPDEDWDYEFPTLATETAKEKADREKMEADADDVRLQQQVLDEVDIMERRFPDKLKGKDPEALRRKIEAEKVVQLELQMQQAAALGVDDGKGGPPANKKGEGEDVG